MEKVAFGYKCEECGQGTVLERIIPEYKTKLKGYSRTVENARIGVCDRCGAEHFDPNETMRWRSLLEEKQAESCLQPTEIRELRKELGLPMEQFATLLGCTRQSLYNWERTDRQSPQSRMADVFMRLIRESHRSGSINVLNFLTSEADKLGIHLAVTPKTKTIAPIIMMPRKVAAREAPSSFALAANTEAPQEEVVMIAEPDELMAKLFYDYTGATLNLLFLKAVPFAEFDAEIRFKDGTSTTSEHAVVKNQEATLLAKTARTEEEVAEVKLLPRELESLSAASSR